jgi:opacity protein-like surface antigen
MAAQPAKWDHSRMIKKSILCVIVTLFVALPAAAQGNGQSFAINKVEITPQVGYLTGDSFFTGLGTLELPGALDYGVTVGIAVTHEAQFEFTYRRTDTELRRRENIGAIETLFDVTINHFLFSGLIEFQEGHRVRPFISIGAGVVNYSTSEVAVTSESRLAFNIRGGAKVFFNKNIGLRVGAAIVPTVDWIGGGIFCGGGGCGGTVSTGSSVVHFDFDAGLIIGF